MNTPTPETEMLLIRNPDDADAFAADALAWHQELGKTSHRSADNLMSALCRVLSFAKEKRRISISPALDAFITANAGDTTRQLALPLRSKP